MEMTALLDGRMRREATVAGEPALEITILADLSKFADDVPVALRLTLSGMVPWQFGGTDVSILLIKTGADARTRTADLLITNHHTRCPLASKYIHCLEIIRVPCPFCPMGSTELQPVVCQLVCQF